MPLLHKMNITRSEYHQHIVMCHGSKLLPQFLAMYRVTVESEDTYLIVMRNMFSCRLDVHRKYNLKGSLVSREASFKEKVRELPTCKDVDFRNNMQKVYVSEEKEGIMDKLRDVESGAEISTIHPEQYTKRFHEFIAEIFA
ncbi:phosphatidylinositol 5-phosphate 4-kinase type-2 gamma-like [Oncorhynchus masou masou]|uniref:phosphatidylinositol 5-phosphate 4-kinase type-2 gamma-like n=1 Tax=Oncorhynchus masou masou TaxID=90313 RepID=UPI003183F3CD